jgi:plasmid stabilization system protein ParE
MEKKVRKVIFADQADQDLVDIYEYGRLTFGENRAQTFLQSTYQKVYDLPLYFLIYPECRYLETKTQIYRNIIIEKYLIIYRIKVNQIEVLRVLHGSVSPKTIKEIKKIKPK